MLPDENSERIQEILSKDSTLERKAYQIYGYYESKFVHNRNRMEEQKRPEWSVARIKVELYKRGDNLTPIDIDL